MHACINAVWIIKLVSFGMLLAGGVALLEPAATESAGRVAGAVWPEFGSAELLAEVAVWPEDDLVG